MEKPLKIPRIWKRELTVKYNYFTFTKESKNNLKSHGIHPLITLYENISFNYIRFVNT